MPGSAWTSTLAPLLFHASAPGPFHEGPVNVPDGPGAERAPDSNFIVSSIRALRIVSENAVKSSQVLRGSTTAGFLYISGVTPRICS